jgi:uncharacterized repeat protein (TIGR03803 family)
MRNHLLSVGCIAVLPTIAVILILNGIAASQERIIANLYSSGGEVLPKGNLIADSNGNLYGTSFYGGQYDQGTVSMLSPTANGYKVTVLHSFNPDGIDGFGPMSGVIMDKAGNLYGSTEFGGSGDCTSGFGCGTVFELTKTAQGWQETILHDFQGFDGWQSYGGLIMDSDGNLYGTTANGGAYKEGTAYKLSPSGNEWNLTTLYNFEGGNDGSVPWSAVVFDSTGNLYGVASQGGGTSAACPYGCGTAFELSPTSSGEWTETVLHNFTTNPNDGEFPSNPLVFDAAGNLYGTTSQGGGGTAQAGIAFELSPDAGEWTEAILHNFNDRLTDGVSPSSVLVFDASGNLYGETLVGGSYGQGTVFRLKQGTHGLWGETVLHNFKLNNDGNNPNGLMIGRDGLFGTTGFGGRYGDGTVFEITP